MTLASWFSSVPSARRRLIQTGDRGNGSRAFQRRASFDALESRRLLSTVSFTSGSETVNQSTGSFSVGVALSSPPAGTTSTTPFAFLDSAKYTGLAVDASGNVYVADLTDNTVLKFTPAGIQSTFATGLLGPNGLAFGPNGDLYVADLFDGVDEVTPTGEVIDIANGSMFNDPDGIAVDPQGNVYVSNSGSGKVVKVTPSGTITTLAKGFQTPIGLAVNAGGEVFVANEDADKINEISPSGQVGNYANVSDGPTGVAFDAAGNLYVVHADGTSLLKVTPTGTQSTFAGGFGNPFALAFDPAGNLYVLQPPELDIERITQTVTVPFSLGGSAVSGVAYSGVTASPLTFGIGHTSLDITGTLLPDPSTTQTLTFTMGTPTGGASLGSPSANTLIITEPSAVQFIAGSETVNEDAGTFSIPVTLSGTSDGPVTVLFTLGGTAFPDVAFSDVTAGSLTFTSGQTTQDITGTLLSDPGPTQTLTLTLGTPVGGAVLGSPSVNTLTITEPQPALVQFRTSSETVNEIAGTFSIPVTVSGTSTGTPGVSTFVSGFAEPFGLAVNAGNVFVANSAGGVVSEVTPAGVTSRFASKFSLPAALAFDSAGNLYVSDIANNNVTEVSPARVVVRTISGFNGPSGLAFDSAGNLYVSNLGSNTVSEVTPAGVVRLFASGFDNPEGLAFDSVGNLYVANNGNNTVSELTPAGVVVRTFSGFNGPGGLAFDAAGNLYVANTSGTTVSEVVPTGVVSNFATGFSDPVGLAINAGTIYVANAGNNTLSEIRDTLVVRFTLSGTAASGVAFSGVTTGPLNFEIGQTTQDITGKLLSDPGPTQTLRFTLGTLSGGAVLGSPSVNTLTITEPAARTSTPTPTPTSIAPLFLGEQRVFSGKGKHKKLTGFEFLFHGPLNAGIAQSTGNFHVTQKHGKKAKVLRVKSALYNPSDFSITMSVAGFTAGSAAQVTITGLVGADGVAIPEIISGL